MIKNISALMLLVVIGMVVPTISFAANDVLDTLISTRLSPKVPGANEDVTISINSDRKSVV